MSGAQGALPPGSRTATTYESVEGGENKTRVDIRSRDIDDQGSIQIDNMQDKVEDAAGGGGPVFGAGAAAAQAEKGGGDQDKPDLGVTGTA